MKRATSSLPKAQQIFPFQDRHLAIAICEDAWNDEHFWEHRMYARDPVDELIRQGGDFLININSSPYLHGQAQAAPRYGGRPGAPS